MADVSTPLPRTAAEIIERIQNPAHEDFANFGAEVLANCLSYEDAKPLLEDGVTKEEWEKNELTLDVESAIAAAIKYLDEYGWDKAINQRGMSAGRSIIKLRTWAWVIGRDGVVTAMDEAGYAQYGVPKLKVWADAFGQEMPDSEDLRTMLEGNLPEEE